MCVCVCVSVCSPPRLVITGGMIWTPYDWLKKYYNFCVAAIVGIVSRHGLRIEAHRRNQPNKSKLVLYKPLLRLCRHLKQPYISNKTKRFSHKGGCGVHGRTRIEVLKEELTWATYKQFQVISNIMLFKTVIPLKAKE